MRQEQVRGRSGGLLGRVRLSHTGAPRLAYSPASPLRHLYVAATGSWLSAGSRCPPPPRDPFPPHLVPRSLFRVMAGLWPLQAGEISLPERGRVFYLSQRPYLVSGTLRDQLLYPFPPAAVWAATQPKDQVRGRPRWRGLAGLRAFTGCGCISSAEGFGRAHDWVAGRLQTLYYVACAKCQHLGQRLITRA